MPRCRFDEVFDNLIAGLYYFVKDFTRLARKTPSRSKATLNK
jgi:hypothetical protein